MSRILIIGNHPEQLLNFRGDLIRHLQSRGHDVVTACPPAPAEIDRRFAKWGVRRLDLALDRTGASLISDLRVLGELYRMFRREQPDVVLAYTIKPVIYGAFAARLAGVPVMAAMITGLGAAFLPPASFKERLVRGMARGLYRLAMRCTDLVFFQNPDDEDDFRRSGLIGTRQRVIRTPGSGVNLDRFARAELPPRPFRFLMIARLIGDKGVREYIAAAARVRRAHPEVEFHLVGPYDSNPSAIGPAEIEAAVAARHIVHHGGQVDVRPFLAACHAYVLPSYREGTPRSVLEALAVGRPVITTDAPGCRETVVEGEQGYLVSVAQVEPLAAAMQRLIEMAPADFERMADAARRLAETRFDVVRVNAQLSAELELAMKPTLQAATR